MFFVIDKSKIFSYLIAVCTVVILFVAASNLNSINSKDTIQTSTNIVTTEELTNNINLNSLNSEK